MADYEIWRRCYPPESFLCVIEKETNKLMAFCTGVKHGDDIGYVGLYIVSPEFRGSGVGPAVFNSCVESL